MPGLVMTPVRQQIYESAKKICDRFDDAYWLDKDGKHEWPTEYHNAAKAAGWPINPDVAVGLLIPVIAGGVWMGLRRLHKSVGGERKSEHIEAPQSHQNLSTEGA